MNLIVAELMSKNNKLTTIKCKSLRVSVNIRLLTQKHEIKTIDTLTRML